MARGRKGILTFLKKVDSVLISRKGRERIFILPNGMTNEQYTRWRIDNRNYLKKLKS